jgi:hypothetical protein
MRTLSIRITLVLMLVALPVCWGAVFPDKTLAANFESLAAVPEPGIILLFGAVLLTLASFMRVRTMR